MTDDYSPRYVGDLSHPLEHTFVDGNGKPHDLSGVNAANMTFVLVNADVNAAGLFKIQAGVPFVDGVLHFEIKELLFKTPL